MRPKTLPIADKYSQCLPAAERMAQSVASSRASFWAIDDMKSWALEAAWRAVNSFDAKFGLTLRQYIQISARRACYDCLRALHNGTRHKWVETCEVPTDLPDESRSAEATVIACEHLQYLRALVEDLPPRERRVLVRYYFHGIGMAEIAGDLGITSQRASNLQRQAFDRIRQRMTTDGKVDA